MPTLIDPVSRYQAEAYAYEAINLVAGAPGVIAMDAISNHNDAYAAINLGINTFRFNGQSVTGLNVSENALISLVDPAPWWASYPYNSLLTPDTTSQIAPLWDNWVTNRNGTPDDTVLYAFRDLNADGIQDQLVIQWTNVDHYDANTAPDGMTFQAILGLNTGATNGDIIFNYVDLANNQGTGDSYLDNGGSATVGIRGGDFALNVGTDGTFGLPVQSGSAIRFTAMPNAPTININLVRDTNPFSRTSYPGWLTTHNGSVFLSANDGVNGNELWKIDASGNASLVKNIRTDTYDMSYNYGSDPYYITSVGSMVYFFAYDQVNGGGLWKSDGSNSNTTRIKSLYGPNVNPDTQEVTVSNGKFYFNNYDPTLGRELWISDGTDAGTTLVKDINVGGGYADPNQLTDVNGTLFFNAYQPTTGWELWKSNGTAAGTTLVKNIALGTDNSDIRQLINLNGTLYFTAVTGSLGRELWKSDGTALGTSQVRDIWAGANSSDPKNLVTHNGLLYFFANNGSGWRLYQSNGTNPGTVTVSTQLFNPTDGGSFNLISVGTQLLFTSYNYSTSRAELWRSDGASAGTTARVAELAGTGAVHDFRIVNGNAYFGYNDGINGDELWMSNGTAAGTGLVKDIQTGADSSTPRKLTPLGSSIYFISDSDRYAWWGGAAPELWKSDGTAAGTVSINLNPTTWDADINTSPFNSIYDDPNAPMLWQNKLYYYADNGVNGRELWSSDGTATGTQMLKDIRPGSVGSTSSVPLNLTLTNNRLFFFAQDGTSGNDQLWSTDGTSVGTTLVKDLGFTWGGATLKMLDLNGRLVFQGYDGTNGWELWSSDGTAAGTGLLKDINPGGAWGAIWPLTKVNNTVFFSADDGVRGRELWKTDGTPGGTSLVRNIAAGVAGSDPDNLFDFNGTLYFTANDGVFGQELWKSDGTAAGTRRIKDINAGAGGSYVANFTTYQNTLYFTAYNNLGQEIWRTDGTTKGTFRITDQPFGTLSDLKVVGNSLYFVNDAAQIWKTDGTNAGTTMVVNHLGGANPTGLTDVNGVLFYSVNDRVYGRELWTSDGTPAGTRIVNDLNPFGSSNPRNLRYDAVKNTLYLLADNGRSGQELFTINRNEAPTDISLAPGKTFENTPAPTNVGLLGSNDRNSFDTFTYALVAGLGDIDNSSFSVSGNQLWLNASADFETKPTYNVRIRSTDQGGLFTEKGFTVLISNVNEAPTDLNLSASSINENVGPTALIGSLNSADPDSNQTFTYSLVAGAGDADNSAAILFGNQLYLKANPDFETKSSYSFRIETRDGDGLAFQKQLALSVINLNDAPTDISLSNNISNENVAINTVIGNLSSTDQDVGNTFTYSLAAGAGDADNASFNISGSALRFSVSPDFETKSIYNLRIRSTDQSGAFYEKPVTVIINNLDNIVIGTSANDTFAATPELDSIQSLDGDDTMNLAIANLQNSELFDGGTGIDTLNISGGAASQTFTIRLGSANQFFSITNAAFSATTIRGFENVSLSSFNGNGSLLGSTAANRLTGSALNDVVRGGAGDDTIAGGAGDDVLSGDAGNDSLSGGIGTDTADYGTDVAGINANLATGVVIDGFGSTDTLIGIETLRGSGFADILIGSAAADNFFAGLGADVITAGLGNDSIALGIDTAIDTVNYTLGDGSDTISNFVRGTGGDILRFSGVTSIDVRVSGAATQFRAGDGIIGNAGFGTGSLLLTTTATTGFGATDVGVNLFNLSNADPTAFAFS